MFAIVFSEHLASENSLLVHVSVYMSSSWVAGDNLGEADVPVVQVGRVVEDGASPGRVRVSCSRPVKEDVIKLRLAEPRAKTLDNLLDSRHASGDGRIVQGRQPIACVEEIRSLRDQYPGHLREVSILSQVEVVPKVPRLELDQRDVQRGAVSFLSAAVDGVGVVDDVLQPIHPPLPRQLVELSWGEQICWLLLSVAHVLQLLHDFVYVGRMDECLRDGRGGGRDPGRLLSLPRQPQQQLAEVQLPVMVLIPRGEPPLHLLLRVPVLHHELLKL
mmetsp:Transcript_23068/g.75100  ORF Transcript_23068/g.75100 Transcript_23068/m.75100 type:complete len:274 (-) Transcript_23068:59-880(-)